MTTFINVSHVPDVNVSTVNGTNILRSNEYREWNIYLEAAILVVICSFGCVGNVLVIKTTIRVESNFARQIMTLFFSLALTDISVCLFRVGLLIYILFYPAWNDGSTLCKLWCLSLITVGIAIWENLLVGVQRIFIIKAFPVFQKYCTILLMVGLVIGIVMCQGLIHSGIFFGFGLHLHFKANELICVVPNNEAIGIIFYRVVVLGIFTGIPLLSAIVCHFWIIHMIIKAGLTKSEKVDDRDNFIKITKTALLRSCMLFICYAPYLVLHILNLPADVMFQSIYRYVDYCLCAHSALHPFITLQDSDFGDATMNKKSIKRQRRNNSSLFNSSIRRVGVSVITSENIKTIKTVE